MTTEEITYIFTDGSSLDNANSEKRRAGSGVYILLDKSPIVSIGNYLGNNTNNYAELHAVLAGLLWCTRAEKYKAKISKNLSFYMDSKYVMNILTGETRNIKVNVKIINKILELVLDMKEQGYNITWNHVKAHTKKKGFFYECNEVVDKLAKEAADKCKDIYQRHDKSD